MRVLIFFILIIITSSCRIAQLIHYKKNEQFKPGNTYVKIETKEQPLVNVKFQSGVSGKLALDLGAGSSFLIKNIGLEYIDTLHPALTFGKYISADNKKVKTTYYKVGNIESDGFSLNNAFLPVINNFLNNPCKSISGFLGSDAFEGKTLVLKFEDSTLAVFDSVPEIDEWSLVTSDYSYPYFYLYFTIGKEKIKLLLDTGSSSDIVISGESFRKIKKNIETSLTNLRIVYGSSFSSASGIIKDTTHIYYTDSGYIGELPVSSSRILVNDRIHRNIIGMQVLKRFNVMLDFKSEKVYLQPNLKWNGLEKRIALREKGLYLKITNDQRIIISSLELNAIAEKIGLQIDDEILSINDIQTDQEDKCSVLEKFNALEWKSQANVVTVKRNEKVLKFEL